MSTLRSSTLPAALILGGSLTLSGCFGSAPIAPASSDAPVGQSFGSLLPGPPSGEVIGAGMVLSHGDDAELCLGPVAESYPPQCTGVPLVDWSWEGLEGAEGEGDVRFGTYAVTGRYDGATFTVTQEPIMLALYDPIAWEHPFGDEPGTATDDELAALSDDIFTRGVEGVLQGWPENGRLIVDVVWDDGTLQRAADDDFGDGAVVVRSTLREIG